MVKDVRRVEMNKKLICFIMVAMFLLPAVDCVSVSVKTNVGAYTERLGAGIDDSIYGSSKITREGVANAIWATSATNSKSSNTGTLNFADTRSVGNANAGAQVGVKITGAKSYSYCYSLYPGTSFVGAAEALDVTSAKTINAWAKAYNAGLHDVGVSTIVNNGNLNGYSNLAIASTDAAGAFQTFDTATGTVQVDSTARTLPSLYTSDVEQDTIPEAYIKTKTTGTISNYEDAAVKSSTGTSIEQNARVVGSFNSISTANDEFIARTSNYGTKYDLDMQANIANSVPSVKGSLSYYITAPLKIQGAVDKSQAGDVINVAPGTYAENVNIQKAVTVRGDSVAGLKSVTNNGGKVYLNAMKVFIRADDLRAMSPVNPSWTWLNDLSTSKDFKAIFAVIPVNEANQIPGTNNALSFLQSLDKNRIELADHGYLHEDFPSLGTYTAQYNRLKSATDFLTLYVYRPRTLVMPYLDANADTVTAAKALGYHTICEDEINGLQGINQFKNDFEWESAWPATGATYRTEADFEAAFNSKYNAGAKTFEIALHPGDTTTASKSDIAKSIDFMKGKTNTYGSGVEFMTFEQYYKLSS